jgi:hypothetical protein
MANISAVKAPVENIIEPKLSLKDIIKSFYKE